MKQHVIAAFVGVLGIVAMAGCSSIPEQEIEAAEAALAAADSAEADVYAADLYVAAADSFAAAHEAIDAQQGLPPQDREYDRARNLLVFVTETATLAQSQVEAGKEATRAEAETLIARAEQLLGMQAAETPGVAVTTGDASSVLADQLASARAAYAEGDYAEAHATARSLVERLQAEQSAPATAEVAATPRS